MFDFIDQLELPELPPRDPQQLTDAFQDNILHMIDGVIDFTFV